MAQGKWDWKNWPEAHPAKAVFNSMANGVRNVKLEGVGRLSRPLRRADAKFLDWNSTLLGQYVDHEAHSVWLRGMAREAGEDATGERLQELASLLGVDTAGLPGSWRARRYVLEQIWAMTPRVWKAPVNAFLYTSAQAAAHEVAARGTGKPEPLVSEHLRLKLEWVLGEKLFGVLKESGVELPEGSHLEFGTASMQGHHDYLGSDLALVVGTNICGRPMYRVAVLQAKWECERRPGTAEVSQGSGTQLDKVFSTGMGFYLFFPRITAERGFMMTVRRAQDVFRDVWSGDEAQFRVDVSGTRDGETHAWDLPLFLAGVMTSPVPDGVGRLFADVDSVCTALMDDRKVPLAAQVVFYDTTGSLKVHAFEGKLPSMGFGVPSIHAQPRATRTADDDNDDADDIVPTGP